jgi:hypothetical protein
MSHKMRRGIEVIALALLVHAAGHGALAAEGARVVQLPFSADPAGFTEVSDSASLMRALRENLVLEAVSSLDIELVVQVGYRVFQSRSDGMEMMGFDQTTPESVQGAGIYLSVTCPSTPLRTGTSSRRGTSSGLPWKASLPIRHGPAAPSCRARMA